MTGIAVTGGIAEGKSTVLGYLREAGYSTDSADEISRRVFQAVGVQAALGELLDMEPPIRAEILRPKLIEPGIRRAVNSIMHPLIHANILESTSDFIEIPLLIETCLQGEFSRVWVVTCGESLQLERLAERLGNEPAAQAQIRTQLASRAKIPFADFVVRTNRDEWDVKRCVTVAAQRDLR